VIIMSSNSADFPKERHGVFPADLSGCDVLSDVLFKAFREDQDLRRIKRFRESEFPQFFPIACRFFLESGKSLSWIYWEKGQPLGGLLAIPSNWNAPASFLWRFFRELFALIGWRSLLMVSSLLRSAWLSRPRKPCLRILFLGVIPEDWGKGIGKALLRQAARTSPFPFLQLEVEKENLKAISLYQKEEFRVEREFKVGRVPFFVMVKNLTKEKEPDQGKNRDQHRN